MCPFEYDNEGSKNNILPRVSKILFDFSHNVDSCALKAREEPMSVSTKKPSKSNLSELQEQTGK